LKVLFISSICNLNFFRMYFPVYSNERLVSFEWNDDLFRMKEVAASNEFFNCFELVSKIYVTFLLQKNTLKVQFHLLLFSYKKSNKKCKAVSASRLQISFRAKI